MLALQNAILEMIARGETLERSAREMCVQIEKLVPGVICSILTIDQTGRLYPLAGPSLPLSYSTALAGLAIGPMVGSCGSAAYLRVPVEVTDIETDPRWADFRHLALPLGLRACWSSPIIAAGGAVIGTFAFYFRDCRGPTEFEKALVERCVHLCVIAIERHEQNIEHQRQIFTDTLTQLPNRAAFNVALASLRCDIEGAWAIFVVDLDNLKIINDTYGHQAGDRLLQRAADRISAASRPALTYRIGGDEFAIVLETSEALRDLEATANRILGSLATAADCGDYAIVPRATIGGALVTPGARVPERVRQNADFALYHAKETGRGGFVRHWPGLGSNMTRRLTAIRDVDAALRDDRIDAYYQPVVRLDTGEVVGMEALCRMTVGGRVLAANAFHEGTTDVHVATALTARMIDIVAADVRAWLDMGIPFQHVGLNVSSADLHGGSIETILTSAFDRAGVPLKHVILEVTESVYMGDADHAIARAVGSLRAKGLRVALDDFGTGYASLTHLLTVPIDIIKIDKSFIDGIVSDEASCAIVHGITQIAAKLNIRIVAEGVETREQADKLLSLGCALGQGYLYSAAINRHYATEMLKQRAQHPDDAALLDDTRSRSATKAI